MGKYCDYYDGQVLCEAYVAQPDGDGSWPAVLIAHQWSGQSDAERDVADRLAGLGYVGIAIDVFGKGIRGIGDDHSGLIGPWLADRGALRQRLLAAVDFAGTVGAVDDRRMAIMGYCFGGLCALDVARSGSDRIRGAISIHGLFSPPQIGVQNDIAASILILHGWDDPMAPPQDVLAVATELSSAKADWQLHAYGHAMHAFTAVGVDKPERGLRYDGNADRRAWAATTAFLAERLT